MLAAYQVPKGALAHTTAREADYRSGNYDEPVSTGAVYSGQQHQADIGRERMEPIEAEGLD